MHHLSLGIHYFLCRNIEGRNQYSPEMLEDGCRYMDDTKWPKICRGRFWIDSWIDLHFESHFIWKLIQSQSNIGSDNYLALNKWWVNSSLGLDELIRMMSVIANCSTQLWYMKNNHCKPTQTADYRGICCCGRSIPYAFSIDPIIASIVLWGQLRYWLLPKAHSRRMWETVDIIHWIPIWMSNFQQATCRWLHKANNKLHFGTYLHIFCSIITQNKDQLTLKGCALVYMFTSITFFIMS